MDPFSTGALEAEFGLDGAVGFRMLAPGMAAASIRHGDAEAEVSLHGAQVLSFGRSGDADALFVSRRSRFEPGKPIRGGIPLCWPWFGPHPADPARGMHGFLRRLPWNVDSSATDGDGTSIVLSRRSDPWTESVWPHSFEARLSVTVGKILSLRLEMRNTDDSPWSCTGAFHPYFRVGDIASVTVGGLDGTRYADKLAGNAGGVQEGQVGIAAAIDRVFRHTGDPVIRDVSLGRSISLAKVGCPSTVVWNPWLEKGAAMDDFIAEEYRSMLCVEPAWVEDEAVKVEPGQSAVVGFDMEIGTLGS